MIAWFTIELSEGRQFEVRIAHDTSFVMTEINFQKSGREHSILTVASILFFSAFLCYFR